MYSEQVVEELRNDISEYAIGDMIEGLKVILRSEKALFLDTGFVSRVGAQEWYECGERIIKEALGGTEPENSVCILTELVLYELKDSQNNVIQRHNRNLLYHLHESGYRIVILCEEKMAELTKECLTMNSKEWNACFVSRIDMNKAYLTTVKRLLDIHPNYREILDYGYKIPTKATFVPEIIKWLKENKKSKDSLAEQIISMCILLLLDLPSKTEYVLCTKDKNAAVNIRRIVGLSYPDEAHRVSAFEMLYGEQCNE